MAEIGNVVVRAVERRGVASKGMVGAAKAAQSAIAKDAVDLKGKKVLVSYLTVGNGHQKAAEAIGEAIKRQHPGVQVSLVDLAKVSTLGRWMAKLFYPLVDSGFYPKFYELTNKPAAGDGLGARFTRWATQKLGGGFVDVVKEASPDAVVSTHLLGAKLVGDAEATGAIKRHIPNFQVVTDEYGHGTYVMDHVDGTFVPSPEVADQLAKKGLDPKTIKVSGIPINPAFADAPAGNVRAALGFDAKARVLLVQGNLVDDVAQYEAMLARLEQAYPNGVNGKPIEVAVTTGKNAKLKADLEALAKTSTKIKLKPFGLLDAPQMRDLMKAADLSVTKPGGLTTAESVAEGLPMVLLDVMKGGQETYNAEHFAKAGAGVSTHDVGEATEQVVQLLGDERKLAAMHDAAEAIGKPDAAAQIAAVTAEALRS